MRRLAALGMLAGWLPALAWGPEGHSLIARIAETELTPAVRARVLEILGPGNSMASISSWADEFRNTHPQTGPWHFINIPLGEVHADMERDCPKGDCVVARIEEFQGVLKDPATPPGNRREALMFIVHFVSDMHQPLHSSNHQDRGGNDVHIVFAGRHGDLHSLWDSRLLSRMGTADALFAKFSSEARRHEKRWARGTVRDWAEQSHQAARKIVYGKLPPPPQPGTPITITTAYEWKADPVVAEQIEKAGVRLASLLNRTLQ